jgi:putative ABC transport system substrate-binding protein
LDNAPIFLDAWRSGLRERGWIERKNLLVEYRYTQPIDRYPALAAELTALSPDLVVAAGAQPAVALKSATTTIPIVFVAVADPVRLGLVQSLSRPGGNITGFAHALRQHYSGKLRLVDMIEMFVQMRDHAWPCGSTSTQASRSAMRTI